MMQLLLLLLAMALPVEKKKSHKKKLFALAATVAVISAGGFITVSDGGLMEGARLQFNSEQCYSSCQAYANVTNVYDQNVTISDFNYSFTAVDQRYQDYADQVHITVQIGHYTKDGFVDTGNILIPGQNVIILNTDDKPPWLVGDWNFKYSQPVTVLGITKTAVLDTKELGWALWGPYQADGDGSKGNLSVTSASTVVNNITHTTASIGFQAYNFTLSSCTGATSNFPNGSDIIIIDMSGTNRSRWENHFGVNINSSCFVSLQNGDNVSWATSSKVQVIRRDNWNNINISGSGTVVPNTVTQSTGEGGIVALIWNGILDTSSTNAINTIDKGYAGGARSASCSVAGIQGDYYDSTGGASTSNNGMGGGGGMGINNARADAAGGAAQGGNGATGTVTGTSGTAGTAGVNSIFNSSTFIYIGVGAGGGGGGVCNADGDSRAGTNGAGAVILYGNKSINLRVTLDSTDAQTTSNGDGDGGTGGAGSMYCDIYNVTFTSVSSSASSLAPSGGDGVIGCHANVTSGTTSPSLINFGNYIFTFTGPPSPAGIFWSQNITNQSTKTYYANILSIKLNATNASTTCQVSTYASNDSRWPINSTNGQINVTGPNASKAGFYSVSFSATDTGTGCGNTIYQNITINVTNDSISFLQLVPNITSNHNSTPYIAFIDFNATNNSPACVLQNYSINDTRLQFSQYGPYVSFNLTETQNINGVPKDATQFNRIPTWAGRSINLVNLTFNPVVNSSGKYGNAITLKGDSGNYVSTNYSLNLTIPYIVCAWATRTGANTSQAELLAGTNGGNGIRWSISATNGSSSNMYNSSGSVIGTGPTTASAANANNYNYYCFGWNTTNLLGCVGNVCASGNNYTNFPDTKYILYPGRGQGTNFGLNGSLDEFSVWQDPQLSFNVSSLQSWINIEANSSLPVNARFLVLRLSFELNNITAGGTMNNTADSNNLANGTLGKGAYYFPGNTSSANNINLGSVNNNPWANITDHAFTMEGVVARDDSTTNSESSMWDVVRYNANCAGGYASGCGGYFLRITTTGAQFEGVVNNATYNGTPNQCIFTATFAAGTTPHHYVVTHDGVRGHNITMYIDKVPQVLVLGSECGNWSLGTERWADPATGSSANICIGESCQHSGTGLRGRVSFIKFHPRLLTALEVNLSYDSNFSYTDGGVIIVPGPNISATGVYNLNVTAYDNCSNIITQMPTFSWLNITDIAPNISVAQLITDGYSDTTIRAYCNATDIDNDIIAINWSVVRNSSSTVSSGLTSYSVGTNFSLYNFTGIAVSNYTLYCNATDSVLVSNTVNATVGPIIAIGDFLNNTCSPIVNVTWQLNGTFYNPVTRRYAANVTFLPINTSACVYNLTLNYSTSRNRSVLINTNYSVTNSSIKCGNITLNSTLQNYSTISTNQSILVNCTLNVSNVYIFNVSFRNILINWSVV